jgi:hypothetical protein
MEVGGSRGVREHMLWFQYRFLLFAQAVCRQVWGIVGQVLWLQNCFLLFDEAFIPPLR